MSAAILVVMGAAMLGMMLFMHGGHKGCGSPEKPVAVSTDTVSGTEAAPEEHTH